MDAAGGGVAGEAASGTSQAGEDTRTAGRAVALALLLTGLVFFHAGIVTSGGDGVPGDLGDLRLSTLTLEHDLRWLTGERPHERLFSPPWFWPHANTLAYSENLLGALPVYALARAASLSPLGAMQALMVVCSITSFAAFYALGRALGASRTGAALGAFLFAFALSRAAHEAQHAQLLPHAPSALCLLAAVRGRPLLAGAALAWQVWCSIYLGFFLGMGIALALAAALCIPAARAALVERVRERPWGWLAGLLLAALLVAPLAPPYVTSSREHQGGRTRGEISAFLPRPASYALPAEHALLARPLRPLAARLPNANEHALFVGVTPWLALAAALALAGGRSPASLRPLLLTAPLAVALTISIDGLSLWMLVCRWIPGAGGIRAVSRVGMLELIPLGLALAWAATACEARLRGRALRVALPTALAALVVAENAGLVPHEASKRAIEARAAAVVTSVARTDCDAFYVVAGPDAEPYVVHVDAMWAAVETGRPTINGYSGLTPPAWGLLADGRAGPAEVADWLLLEGRDPAAVRVAVVRPEAGKRPSPSDETNR